MLTKMLTAGKDRHLGKLMRYKVTNDEFLNTASFFLLRDRPKKSKIIDEALEAEHLECWIVALDLYLAFWLWVEDLPKKYRKVNHVFRLEDYL